MDERSSQQFLAKMVAAPLRVSLAGGGTDLASYHLGRGGLVVSLTIDRFVVVHAFPRAFDNSVTTRFDHTAVAESPSLVVDGYVRSALSRVGVSHGIQISSSSDVPFGTGLGASGSFSVALLQAISTGTAIDTGRRAWLAETGSDLEIVDLGRSVGRHDHYMAAYGGLRALEISPEGRFEPVPLPLTDQIETYVRDRLLLFYVGGTRDAGAALSAQDWGARRGDSRVLDALGSIHRLAERVRTGIVHGEIEGIGEALHEHWMLKRSLSTSVSNAQIDVLYEQARDAGADGGKLLGAGMGGFLLLSVRDDRDAASVRKAMQQMGLPELSFQLEPEGVRETALPIGRDLRAHLRTIGPRQ